MGKALQPRVIRSGEYFPSAPRTGTDDGTIFRKSNLITVGRNGRYYEMTYSGEGDLDQNLTLVPLTGTLDLTANSTTVLGTGTLLLSEVHLGQRILVIEMDGVTAVASWLIIPQRIISDTEMEIWKAPDTTIAGLTGWQMPRAYTVNQQIGTSLWGNFIELDKGTLLGVGTGIARLGGVDIPGTTWTLTREPQIALFDPVTSLYSGTFTLGMDTPVAPTLAAVGAGTKDMQAGSYSIVITPARKETGGYNNPSLRADVTIATGDQIEITFPAMDTTNGQNAWDVWVTTYAFSLSANLNYLLGPWFYYTTVTDDDVSSGGGTFNVEWYDAEVTVNETVTFNNDPPSQAEFVELLNFTPTWISCRGKGYTRGLTTVVDPSPGPFIEPAKVSNIEAAPIDVQFASSPPEVILGAASADGRIYLLTPQHLEIAQATPDETVPILIRPFWRSGFANPEQLVPIPGGQLYGYTSAGPVRSAANGDESSIESDWAAKVYEITKDWNLGQVLSGFDPLNNMWVVFHVADHLNEAGYWTTRMLGFGLSQNFWIFDGLISSDEDDRIVCGVTTLGERLIVLVGGRNTIAPFTYDITTEDDDPLITEIADGGDLIIQET